MPLNRPGLETKIATTQDLIKALSPLLEDLAKIEPRSEETAIRLNETWPIDSGKLRPFDNLWWRSSRGLVAPRGEEGMKWGRLSKASEETHGYSIDGVLISQAGPGHAHPNGEFDLCFTIEGQPLFDGQPEGWVVYGPNSWHIPTVEGGQMAILYFLPEGAIRFGPKTQVEA